MKKIGVIGAGTWGMALARVLFNNGHEVTIRPSRPQSAHGLAATRRHPNLPDMVIPDGIVFTPNMEAACTGKDILLFAVPSTYVRSAARQAAPFIPEGQIIVNVAKGFEPVTMMSMTDVIAEELMGKPVHLVALSGPTHAEEVARDLPTAIVSACENEEIAREVQTLFQGSCIRTYTNNDVLGVEICGALKNVMALAAGISCGLGYGDNIKAAIITRGISEMTRLGIAMDCSPMTYGGLAGVGDLIVTATSTHSRNNRCGMLIGQGMPVQEAIAQIGMVVEGINALPAAMEMKKYYGVDMPIVDAVNAVINEGMAPADAVKWLMERKTKPEFEL